MSKEQTQMSKILVAYASFAGSTADVARAVGEEIAKAGGEVDVLPLNQITNLEGYAGLVLGAPMIMGWHRAALRFLRRNRQALQHIPLAVFVMAMSLTQTGQTDIDGVLVFVDEKLPKPPKNEGRLSFRERYASVSNYLRPILRAARSPKPVRIGMFAGRLDYGRLKWWAVLFAMVIVQAPAGDRRNWPAIRAWAAEIPAAFRLSPQKSPPLP